MTIRTNLRSVSAAAMLGVAALTATAAPMVLAPAAVAQGPEAPNPANIDANRSGSITIHKFEGDAANKQQGQEIDGLPKTDANLGKPMDGAVFKVQQVEADLTTNNGFAEAAKLTVDNAVVKPGGASQEITTENGVATATDLPVGVYLVTETEAPDGYDISVAPFLVFLPMTNPNSTEWNYDVHVYPKNWVKGQVLKNITDTDGDIDYDNVGDEISFDVYSQVPQPIGDTPLSQYMVVDQLQGNIIDSDASKVTLSLKTGTIPAKEDGALSDPQNDTEIPTGLKDAGVQLVKDTDYYVVVDDNEKVTAWFTDKGLAKLTKAKKDNPNLIVDTNIGATVKAVDEANGGVLKNQATVYSNNGVGGGTPGDNNTPDVPPTPENPGEETNVVEARWGTLVINKVDPAGKALVASFDLYRCDADGNLLGDKLSVAGQNSWTTDSNGVVSINGLHTTDLVKDQGTEEAFKYCLVETDAAEGFQLLPKPVVITFTKAGLEKNNVVLDPSTGITDNNTNLVAEVTNQNTPKLPLTGGKGIALIVAIGVALVGGGVAYARRASKKA